MQNQASIEASATRTDETHRQTAFAVATVAIAGAVAGAIDLVVNTVKAVSAGTSVLRPWKGVAAALQKIWWAVGALCCPYSAG
jgi:hypothetical protein